MNKFLDESKIIKKQREELTEDINVDIIQSEPEDLPPIPTETVRTVVTTRVEEKPKRKSAPKKKKTITVNSNVEEAKTKEQIKIELYNRLQTQFVQREVELELYHRLYENARSTSERQNAKLQYENSEKDIKLLKQKIEILDAMIHG